MHETFTSLLSDRAHWEFELFLMFIVDGIIGAVIWPFVRRHMKQHHNVEMPVRDTRDSTEQVCVGCDRAWSGHWIRDEQPTCILFHGQDGVIRDCTDPAPPHMSRR